MLVEDIATLEMERRRIDRTQAGLLARQIEPERNTRFRWAANLVHPKDLGGLNLLEHFDPLVDRKERLLLDVRQHRDHQVVKELAPALNKVEVTVRDRIERPWVNGANLRHERNSVARRRGSELKHPFYRSISSLVNGYLMTEWVRHRTSPFSSRSSVPWVIERIG